MQELKPCPFCGAKPTFIRKNSAFGVQCTCNNRSFICLYGKTEDDAISNWNERPAPVRESTQPVDCTACDIGVLGNHSCPVTESDCATYFKKWFAQDTLSAHGSNEGLCWFGFKAGWEARPMRESGELEYLRQWHHVTQHLIGTVALYFQQGDSAKAEDRFYHYRAQLPEFGLSSEITGIEGQL